eukprot:Selendium_serpulae@DN5987_c0_g1_i13.p1
MNETSDSQRLTDDPSEANSLEWDECQNENESNLARTSNGALLLLSLGTITTGSFNYVIGKIRAKPFGQYDYFVSLFNSIVYTLIYWIILLRRYKTGKVTKSDFSFVWSRRCPSRDHNALVAPAAREIESPSHAGRINRRRIPILALFLIAGLCDAWGNILGFIAQPWLPGPIYSLMNQAIIPFTVIISVILLRRRYTATQLVSVCVVISGGLFSLIPDLSAAVLGTHEVYSAAAGSGWRSLASEEIGRKTADMFCSERKNFQSL